MLWSQANFPMAVTTPAGEDALLLVGLSGSEAVSRLYRFHLDVIAQNERNGEVPFDKVLGQSISVRLNLPDGSKRYYSGICASFSQGGRDETFTSYRMEMVPHLWLLTRKAQSRIFQQVTVPDILKAVLGGLVVDYQIKGTFEKRDYCVQYRETDFNFASRLMEEEGIYYFFKHTSGGDQLVLANTPGSHADTEHGNQIIFQTVEGGALKDARIYSWEKVQELRSGKYTLWDHTFEKPHQHLEATQTIQDTVAVGAVSHKLKTAGNQGLELYDFPGEYAQRFDGVDKGGGDQPSELAKISTDNVRTVGIRMQEEALPGLVIHGTSNCGQLVSGYKITLQKHFNADGDYVVTSIDHHATEGAYRSGQGHGFSYHNAFTCIPLALPYRPTRVTPKPFVQGTQTAVVVGPPGEEIFTDKYGRVKVQFHWDRLGKNNADSSCWIRVAQPWAGKRWGAFFWPRIGQEVVVAFEEGDPDRPIIVGSVYNADQMPPYLGKGPDTKHPNDNKLTGIKSNTTTGGKGFNEWRFDDTKGKEQVFIHAERDMDTRVKHDSRERVIHDRDLVVGWDHTDDDTGEETKGGDQRELVWQDKHLNIKRDQKEKIEGNLSLTVGKGDANGGNVDIVIAQDKKELIEQNSHLHVKENRKEKVDQNQGLTVGGNLSESIKGKYNLHVTGDRNEKVDGTQSLTIGMNQQEKVGQNHAMEAGQAIYLKAGMTLVLEGGMQLSLKVGGNFVDIGPAGVSIVGSMVMINSGGGPGSGNAPSPTSPDEPDAPDDAQEAKPDQAKLADDAKTGYKSAPS